MLHKKIIEPVLGRLDKERASYFSSIVDKLDEDPRAQRAPNLVYLVLKETIPFLPIYLPATQFINELLLFVHNNRVELNKALYSRDYVEEPESIRKITNGFVEKVLELTLDEYKDGNIESGEQKVYKVSWPYEFNDFPYADLDDD